MLTNLIPARNEPTKVTYSKISTITLYFHSTLICGADFFTGNCIKLCNLNEYISAPNRQSISLMTKDVNYA